MYPQPIDDRATWTSCERFLGRRPRTIKEQLHALAAGADSAELPDVYGKGPLLEDFEHEVAALLGKESAVFMPSGTMAQQILMRVVTDKAGNPKVAMHSQSHPMLHEQRGFEYLHDLQHIELGAEGELFTLSDLERVAHTGMILMEVPERELGGILRDWHELVAISQWARERGIWLHMDGARLWEAQPFYNRPFAEIAGVFDSVYVSFYKGLGAIAGAALAGPRDTVEEARTWQHRHGGRLVQAFPFVLSARSALRENMNDMARRYNHAKALAADLPANEDLRLRPNPPQTSMFHLHFRREKERLVEAALSVAAQTQTWIFNAFSAAKDPNWQVAELNVGPNGNEISPEQFGTIVSLVLERSL